ncbi:MAG TPA: DUF262 domain-containing protein [Methanospirillum sp.]|nr:DUF262 domain-containing protein [Methanospirillum sp.]
MKAAKSSVWDLYNGAKQYVVPLFQRPYVWSRAQWEQLWSDITEQYKLQADRPKEKIPDRFLGSIVVVREYQKNLDKYTIIDGQQRVTTISIILAVIRAFAKERNLPDLYTQITDFLLNSPRSGEGQYVVIPTRVDKAALYHIFNEDYSFEYDSQIVECFDFFWRMIDESKDLDLNTLQQVITEDLCVVYIELDQGENPNQVFEALNYRGVPLEESDLIRNFFFASLESPDIAEAQYDQFWKPMEDRFENRQELISRFLRYFSMRTGETIRIGEIFERIRKTYLSADPDIIRLLLRDINRYSDYYLRLISPDSYAEQKFGSVDVLTHLIRLNTLSADSAAPFLMNCLAWNDGVRNQKQRLSDQDLVRVLHLIETYLIRRSVCGRPDNGYEEVFGPLCSEMDSLSEPLPDHLTRYLVSLAEPYRMPDNDEFDDHLRFSDLYLPGENNSVAWVILTALEDFFSSQNQADRIAGVDLFDDGPKDRMIDHIMPVHLSTWWRDHLGTECQAVHQDFLHRLGNLTLTLENSAILNADFETKKAWYALDNQMLNSSMKGIRFWRRFQIDQRSGVLAAFCLKIWPYEMPPEIPPAPDSESVTCLRSGEIPRLVKPVEMIIGGRSYPVKYWYQVLELTVRDIYEQEPQKFDRIVREWPIYFSEDTTAFKSIVGPYSFKSRFGRYQIRDMCIAMIRLVGWSEETWCLVCE